PISDSFQHLEPVPPPDEGFRPLEKHVVEFGAVLASDLKDISEAFRGHEGDLRHLEAELSAKEVRADGPHMEHDPDLPGTDPPMEKLRDSRQHSFLGRHGLRRDFEEIEAPGGLVECGQVGEGASDVDGHAKSRHDCLPRRASAFNKGDPAIRVPTCKSCDSRPTIVPSVCSHAASPDPGCCGPFGIMTATTRF